MFITVNEEATFEDGGTVMLCHTGKVTFAGDWRPMRALRDEVESTGEVEVFVEDWQVLS